MHYHIHTCAHVCAHNTHIKIKEKVLEIKYGGRAPAGHVQSPDSIQPLVLEGKKKNKRGDVWEEVGKLGKEEKKIALEQTWNIAHLQSRHSM